MIDTVVSVKLPIGEMLRIKRNRLMPDVVTGEEKRICLVSGIYGDELGGQYICGEIIRRIKAEFENLTGIVDVYPAVNPLGLDARTRAVPISDIDYSSAFPGDINGGLEDYTAAKLIEDIKGASCCIDIHSSNIFLQEVPQVRLNNDYDETLLHLSKYMNTDLVWIHPSQTVNEGSLAFTLNQMGIPTMVTESGAAFRIRYEYCRQIIDGIFSVMAELGIWKGKVQGKTKVPFIHEDQIFYLNCESSGLFVSYKRLKDPVKKGEIIGIVQNPLMGATEEEVVAPTDGILMTLREHPSVTEGSLVARVRECTMKKEIIYSSGNYLRDEFKIEGYLFGKQSEGSEPAACIVGAMRGNEYQQLYICSQLVKRLKELENSGAIVGDNQILVIPCVNNFSMNVGMKYWVSDNSDINRQFPGNFDGEPTSRLAAHLFERVKGFRYGIHFASFFRSGDFVPHVRMPATGKESTSLASLFGLPYVLTSKQRNFDKKTLTYNWQINGTDAFSVYSGETDNIDVNLARKAVSAVLRLTRMGILKYNCHNGYIASIIEEEDLVSVKASAPGFLRRFVTINEEVNRGQLLGEVINPYNGEILSEIRSTADGIIFYAEDQPTILENASAFQVIKKLHE